MSANSLQKTPVISTWLHDATIQLVGAGISSAKLDAEIILGHTLRKNRTFLHAHGEVTLTNRQAEIADARLRLRLDRTPVAYIIGHKEFYGRLFQVTPATLIPRPESETIITILKELRPKNIPLLNDTPLRLVDVGTGSGCLGITAKLEMPEFEVTLLDISRHALTIAQSNASKLEATIIVKQSDLLAEYPLRADFIVANLPYVDVEWERSPETQYEPDIALFAPNHGLRLIDLLIRQAEAHMNPRSFLLLEADPRQHDTIIATAKNHGFNKREIRDFIIVLQKD